MPPSLRWCWLLTAAARACHPNHHRWLPSKARDVDMSPYASPRASSPLAPFPLACIAAAQQAVAAASEASKAASEAASGSVTPGGFSGDDASPRAVLHNASARLLFEHEAAQGGGGAPGQHPPHLGAPNLVRKSLLTSSLAPSRRGASPEPQHRRSGSLGLDAPASGAATVAATAQPQLVRPPAVVHHGGATGGMSYRIASEWQQPAIHTVKMQGPQPMK